MRGGYRGGRGRYRQQNYGYEDGGYQEVETKQHHQRKSNKNAQKFQHGEYKRREDQPKVSEKKEEETEENKVYYPADDFISRYDGLPEKTEYLVRELCEGTIQCPICHNEISQIAAIWN